MLILLVYAPVAQSVEQLPFKEMVVGSIPTGRTKSGRFCANHRHVGAEVGSRDFSAEKYL